MVGRPPDGNGPGGGPSHPAPAAAAVARRAAVTLVAALAGVLTLAIGLGLLAASFVPPEAVGALGVVLVAGSVAFFSVAAVGLPRRRGDR